MGSCSTGQCGTNVPMSPPAPAPQTASVVNGNSAKSYKGNLFYPLLEVQLSSSSGVPVQGHVKMRTGMGILSTAEGDTHLFVPPGALPMVGSLIFSAPMRRGFVTIEVSGAKCLKGLNFPNKKTRHFHYKKEVLQITWEKSEAIP